MNNTALVPMPAEQINLAVQAGSLSQALALAEEAGDISRMRDVHAIGSALQKGARLRGMGVESENLAAEVVVRAERAMGLALADMLATGQRRASGKQTGRSQGKGVAGLPPTLDEVLDAAGVTATPPTLQAWRKLAAIPDETFERMIADIKGATERIARVKFLAKRRTTEEAAEAERVRAYNAEVREATDERATPAFARFRDAASALVLSRLPEDELRAVGMLLQALAGEYQTERARRTQ